jgi:hypothetical protein
MVLALLADVHPGLLELDMELIADFHRDQRSSGYRSWNPDAPAHSSTESL